MSKPPFFQASTLGRKVNSFTVAKGAVTPLYVGSVNAEKCSKNPTIGQYLTGTLTLAKV